MTRKKLVIGLLVLVIPLVSGHADHDHSQETGGTEFLDNFDGFLTPVVVIGEVVFGLVLLVMALEKYREDSESS